MDLFPKDYKKNGFPPMAAVSESGFSGFLKNAKDKLAAGKDSLSANSRVREALSRLGMILASTALVLALLLWGGLYFYKNSLVSQINDMRKRQAEIFSAEDKELAAKIADLDERANLAQALLKNHVYASGVFDKLASATVPRVQWRSFGLSVKDRGLSLSGFSADYANLAKQILSLKESGFSDVKISGIALDKSGGVSFSAGMNFDPKILQK